MTQAHPVRPARVRVATVDPSAVLGPSDPAPEYLAGIVEISCGYCGVRLTAYDTRSGFMSDDGWTRDGSTRRPRRGYRQRVARKTAVVAISAGSWLHGDHRLIALFPVSAENGWSSPALPVVFECHRCRRPSRFDAALLLSLESGSVGT
jgi:hypothetical protein